MSICRAFQWLATKPTWMIQAENRGFKRLSGCSRTHGDAGSQLEETGAHGGVLAENAVQLSAALPEHRPPAHALGTLPAQTLEAPAGPPPQQALSYSPRSKFRHVRAPDGGRVLTAFHAQPRSC